MYKSTRIFLNQIYMHKLKSLDHIIINRTLKNEAKTAFFKNDYVHLHIKLIWKWNLKTVSYLVKSGGTGVVTKDAMGLRWTCWNIMRISELLDINSLLLQDRNCVRKQSTWLNKQNYYSVANKNCFGYILKKIRLKK